MKINNCKIGTEVEVKKNVNVIGDCDKIPGGTKAVIIDIENFCSSPLVRISYYGGKRWIKPKWLRRVKE